MNNLKEYFDTIQTVKENVDAVKDEASVLCKHAGANCEICGINNCFGMCAYSMLINASISLNKAIEYYKENRKLIELESENEQET